MSKRGSKGGSALKKKAKARAEKLAKKQAGKDAKKRDRAKGRKEVRSKKDKRSVTSSVQEAPAKAAQGAVDAASSVAVSATEALVRRGSKLLAKTDRALTVGGLEKALLKLFPASTAESWDRTGLLVGDRTRSLGKVAITLDPTVAAIEEAAALGADVLLTHHPAYLSAPDSFSPAPSVALDPGAGVWAAIKGDVALMCFHTALDVSRQAQGVLPSLLGLTPKGKVLSPLPRSRSMGYGQICSAAAKDEPACSLSHLAARCTSVFGRAPRVWGRFDAVIASVVTATGSASDLGRLALDAGIDCLVCGEIRYHDALELSGAGLCIIELGHDVSEFPLTAVLADAVASYGMDAANIIVIDQTDDWRYPESIRL